MDRETLLNLLHGIQAGRLSVEDGIRQVEQDSFADLGFAKLDLQRAARIGFPEVVFAQGKTPEQVRAICERLLAGHSRVLVTRLEPAVHAQIAAALPAGHFNPLARTWSFGLEQTTGVGDVLVLCAGTSDLPVAEEAFETARLMGASAELIADVGVAGLHRLLAQQQRMARARVMVVVAGMEGALPSVVGGLASVPVVAVPTSVGYGASFGGATALLAMLNSCAPGVTVVNIDNGFGAGYAAAMINRTGLAAATAADAAPGA